MSVSVLKNTATASVKIPAEWEEQAVLWTAWPSHPELWQEDLEPARAEIAQMVKMVAEAQKVKILAMGEDAVCSAQAALGDAAEIIETRFGDIWLRDTGPIFTADGSALSFKTNGWGGKYELPFDNEVSGFVAQCSNKNTKRFDFILEGGALEHNGAGAVLTTRQCVLNQNRNSWSEAEAETALKDSLGAQDIFWLDDGLMNDHTDGHIDNLARFVAADTVLCQSAFGADDPNAALYEKTASDLKAMGFNVVQIPSPGLVKNDDGEIVPASHMNFIITNKAVIVPVYGTASADAAVEGIAKLFPGRRVKSVSSIALLSGGGSFHCITQQEPA